MEIQLNKNPSNCIIGHTCVGVNIYEELLKSGISNEFIEIKKSKIKNSGLGVFAKKDFAEQEVIERCHVIVLDWRTSYPYPPAIPKYAYTCACECNECQKYGQRQGISLGYGSIYNTALKREDANAVWYFNIHTPVQIFICSKPIKMGEEILVYYGDGYVQSMIKNSPPDQIEHNDNPIYRAKLIVPN
jgi:hypothetical protein